MSGQPRLQYSAGNPFSRYISVSEAAVLWQGLTPEQASCASIMDGLPHLEGCPELAQRAQALLEAAQHGEVLGLVHNEDGYALHATAVRLQRASAIAWIQAQDPAAPVEAASRPDRLATLEEACEILGISRSAFYRARKAGTIEEPHFESPNRWRLSYLQRVIKG